MSAHACTGPTSMPATTKLPSCEPIVVVGRGQSGTRFLAEALQKQGVFIGGNINRMFDSLSWERLVQDVVDNVYPRYDELEDGDAWHNKVQETAIQFLQEGYSGGRWGWKLGITAFIIPLLARVFPNLRVLHLIRDGRDVMLSRLRRVARLPHNRCDRMMILGDADATCWWGRRINGFNVRRYRNEFEMHAWVQFVNAARRYGQSLGPQRYFELRYEDMCTQPVQTLDGAFKFIGLRMTAEVEQFLKASSRTDRIGKWRSVPKRKLSSAISIGKLLLTELGYESQEEPMAPQEASPRSGFWRWLTGESRQPAATIGTQGYLVLGMHRSGTSCLAGLLETTGLYLGKVSRHNRHNEKGNLENEAVQAVNTAILQQFGGTWSNPPARIDSKQIDPKPLLQALQTIGQHERWVIKDPRILLTLDEWLPLMTRCQMIGTFRHPVAVARSLEMRNGMPLDEGVKLWTVYNERLVDLHRRRAFPLLNFDLEPSSYLQQFSQACELLDLTVNAAAAAEFYEPELVNAKHDTDLSLPPHTSNLYQYLLQHQIQTKQQPFPRRAAG
jgi:hypothetical protein